MSKKTQKFPNDDCHLPQFFQKKFQFILVAEAPVTVLLLSLHKSNVNSIAFFESVWKLDNVLANFKNLATHHFFLELS